MCRPASFVLTKDKVFWSKTSESHEDIISEFSLHDSLGIVPNILRVEIVPPSNRLGAPLDSWEFSVDQDVYPNWFDPNVPDSDAEERARIALKQWYAYKVIETFRLVKEGVFYAVKEARVQACRDVVVHAYDDACVEGGDHARVHLRDHAKGRMYGKAYACAYDDAEVTAFGHAEVEAAGRASVTAHEHATVIAGENSKCEASGSAQVHAYDESVVEASGGAIVWACGKATVRARDFATVFVDCGDPTVTLEGAFAVLVDRRPERAAVCTTGKR